MYFDTFGSHQPPTDLIKYLGDGSFIKYNHERYQNYDSLNVDICASNFYVDSLA